jgi:Domain of unknown function (DUF4160)
MKVLEDERQNLYVYVHTNDHDPAHVHIFKGRKNDTNRYEIKINLGSENIPPFIVKANPDMAKKDIKAAWQLVADNQETLLEKWKEIHGNKKMDNK